MTALDAYLTLNMLPCVGPVRVRKLRERLGSVESILLARESELRSVEGIGAEVARSLVRERETVDIEKEKALATELGVTLIHQESSDYPSQLNEIHDPPLVLYVKGQTPEHWRRGVAMVGSRKTTHYGSECAKKLGYQIAFAGVPVISGLARGIDTAAHQGALAAKGITWAVLGCSLDQPMYPPENSALAEKITEQGCLISEFPFGTKPDKQTFPMRNRIVSGLSFGVLVIEADTNSGAMITARQGLEQGRQIFAVPGRIDNPQARGCHKLIKDGARLVEGVQDILSELEFLPLARETESTKPQHSKMPDHMTEEETRVFAMIDEDETPIDVIIQKTGLPSGAVSSTLLRLEMKKLVKQLPGKFFVRTM